MTENRPGSTAIRDASILSVPADRDACRNERPIVSLFSGIKYVYRR
jgi:hypothetical protein